jgi:endonuclease YncB( thermonuclease family)
VTIYKNGANINEALVSKGLATLIVSKVATSPYADSLVIAEQTAKDAKRNVHSGSDKECRIVIDANENAEKARSFFKGLQRLGTFNAVVEYVYSASRFKILVQSQNLKINFALSGVVTPRGPRKDGEKGERFASESSKFVSRHVNQRLVEITIDAQDRAGCFQGSMSIKNNGVNSNVALLLIQEGFGLLHHSSYQTTPSFKQLQEAEIIAKRDKKNIWQFEVAVEPDFVVKVETCSVKSVNLTSICIQAINMKSDAPLNSVTLAYITVSPDYEEEFLHHAKNLLEGRNVACKFIGPKKVIISKDGSDSVNESLLHEGLAYISKGIKRSSELEPFFLAQENAMKMRINAW